MRHKRIAVLSVLVLTLGVVGFSLQSVGAASANISKSYRSDIEAPLGSLVSLDPKKTGYVQPANSKNAPNVVGIVVKASDSLLAVDSAAGQLQVANSGTATALVTTLNGDIKVGDQVGVSPFNGWGQKSSPGGYVVGLAQTSFTSGSEGAVKRDITDSLGNRKQISVGYVRLGIAVGRANASDPSAVALNSLQKFIKALTGRTVPTFRIILSLVIALVAFVSLITLVYGAIHSGIISVGRNPLAKYAVMRSVSVALVMSLGIMVVAVAAIALLLRV